MLLLIAVVVSIFEFAMCWPDGGNGGNTGSGGDGGNDGDGGDGGDGGDEFTIVVTQEPNEGITWGTEVTITVRSESCDSVDLYLYGCGC